MTTPNPTTTATSSRLFFRTASPTTYKALLGLDAAARDGIDPALAELIRIRASQLNGCAYCLHMHAADARKAGETEDRLTMVALWHDAPSFFTDAERAALELTEAVTQIAGGVSDELYARVAVHFDEHDIAQLLALIFTINAWNRIGVSTGRVPGDDHRAH